MERILEKHTQMIECPSCGRATPKADVGCHHCGARIGKKGRISLKKTHQAILIMALIGFAFLGYGYYTATHIRAINEINSEMADKTVLIKGVLMEINYDSRYQRTTFIINDGTGEIEAFGWSDLTSALVEQNAIPDIGDVLIIEGKVNVYEKTDGSVKVSIEILQASSIDVIVQSAPLRNVGNLLFSDVGQKITIQGNVTDRYVGYSGSSIKYVSLEITDATGSIPVYIGQDLLELTPNVLIVPNETQIVRITGVLTEYNGALELIPSNLTNAITILS